MQKIQAYPVTNVELTKLQHFRNLVQDERVGGSNSALQTLVDYETSSQALTHLRSMRCSHFSWPMAGNLRAPGSCATPVLETSLSRRPARPTSRVALPIRGLILYDPVEAQEQGNRAVSVPFVVLYIENAVLRTICCAVSRCIYVFTRIRFLPRYFVHVALTSASSRSCRPLTHFA
jgi:hypothetical protein